MLTVRVLGLISLHGPRNMIGYGFKRRNIMTCGLRPPDGLNGIGERDTGRSLRVK